MTKEIASCCSGTSGNSHFVDPVCGMRIAKTQPGLHWTSGGSEFYFCSSNCMRIFKHNHDNTTLSAHINRGKSPALIVGMSGAIGLIILFLIVISIILTNSSYEFALSEVKRLWYWVLLLSTGFGLQLGLFAHIRQTVNQKLTAAKAELAASGAVSSGSMVACCSHALVTLLPFLGISAAATFLARYQLSFLLLGLFSNLLGVTVMIGLAQKHKIEFKNPFLKFLSSLSMKALRIFLVVMGLIALGISLAAA